MYPCFVSNLQAIYVLIKARSNRLPVKTPELGRAYNLGLLSPQWNFYYEVPSTITIYVATIVYFLI
jgi:hypothetical protein